MWEFAGDHTEAFVIIILVGALLIRRMVYATARVLMVRKHGWPPAHLDADGDYRSSASSDEDEEA